MLKIHDLEESKGALWNRVHKLDKRDETTWFQITKHHREIIVKPENPNCCNDPKYRIIDEFPKKEDNGLTYYITQWQCSSCHTFKTIGELMDTVVEDED